MTEVMLKDYIPSRVITQESSWKMVYDAIVENGLQDAIINFTDITVDNPWDFENFLDLVKNTNIKIKFINRTSLYNQLCIFFMSRGLDSKRIIQVVVEPPKEPSRYEKNIERNGADYVRYLNFDESTGTLGMNANECLHNSTLSDDLTVRSVLRAFEIWTREHPDIKVSQYVFNCTQISVKEEAMSSMAKYIVSWGAEGKVLACDLRDEEVTKLIEYIEKESAEPMSVVEKLDVWKKVPIGAVGILVEYKKTRRTDIKGRSGDGQTLSSLPCRFDGIIDTKRGKRLKFTRFDKETFYTKDHWFAQHDGELHPGLNSKEIVDTVDSIGIHIDNIPEVEGRYFKFRVPITRKPQLVISLNSVTGNNIKSECCLAKRIECVLDDWGIDYNREWLEKYNSDK